MELCCFSQGCEALALLLWTLSEEVNSCSVLGQMVGKEPLLFRACFCCWGSAGHLDRWVLGWPPGFAQQDSGDG